MQLAWAIEDGNLPALVSDDSPAVLVDALGVYRMALLATRAEEARLRRPKKPPPPK
ncbi:hypothetical protein [Sandaracinus amylolyticus]|nr:hypothetical protein [Sandaracinus amylolyticus]